MGPEWRVEAVLVGGPGWLALRQERPGDAAGWEALVARGSRVLVSSGRLEQVRDDATRWPSRAAALAAAQRVGRAP